MNRFELYCMVFYVLDAEWDENKNPQLGEFLSGANPFLFDDIGSADPTIYEKFCEIVDGNITVENSYGIASKYISELGNEVVSSAFSTIDENEWVECVKDFLSSEHKGSDAK